MHIFSLGLSLNALADQSNEVTGSRVQAMSVSASHDKIAHDSSMDREVLPGEDFNRFANGAWEKSAQIPDNKVAVGIFATLIDESDAKVASIIDAAKHAASGSAERKIGDYYQAYLNIDLINQRGIEPLQVFLKKSPQ